MKYFPPMILSCLLLIVFLILVYKIILRRIKDTSTEFWSFGGETASRSLSKAYGAASKGLNTLASAYGLAGRAAGNKGFSGLAAAASKRSSKLGELAENAQHQSYRRGEKADLLAERRSIAEDKLNPYNDKAELNNKERETIDKINAQSKQFSKELDGVSRYGSVRKYLSQEDPDKLATIFNYEQGGAGSSDTGAGLDIDTLNKEDSLAYSEISDLGNNKIVKTASKEIVDYNQGTGVEIATVLTSDEAGSMETLEKINKVSTGKVSAGNVKEIFELVDTESLESNGFAVNHETGEYNVTDYAKATSFLGKVDVKLDTNSSNFKFTADSGESLNLDGVRDKLINVSDTELYDNGIERDDEGNLSIYTPELASKFLNSKGISTGIETGGYSLEVGENTSSILGKDLEGRLSGNTKEILEFNRFVKEKGHEVVSAGGNKFLYKVNSEMFKKLSDSYFYSKSGNNTVFSDNLPIITGRNYEGNFQVRKGYVADIKDSEYENFVNKVDTDSRFIRGVNYEIDTESGKVAVYDRNLESIANSFGHLENGIRSNIVISNDEINGSNYLKAASMAISGSSRYGSFVVTNNDGNLLEDRKAISSVEDRLNPIETCENLFFDNKDKREIMSLARESGISNLVKETKNGIVVRMDESNSFLDFYDKTLTKGIDSTTEVSIACTNEEKLRKLGAINKELFKGSVALGSGEFLLTKEAGLAAGDLKELQNILNRSLVNSDEQVKVLDKGKIYCQDVDEVLKLISNENLENPYLEDVHYDVVGSEIVFKANSELYNDQEALKKLADRINLDKSSMIVGEDGLYKLNKYIKENNKETLISGKDFTRSNEVIYLKSLYAKSVAMELNNLSHNLFINEIADKASKYRDELILDVNNVSYKDMYDTNKESEESNILTLNFGNKLNNQAFLSLLGSERLDSNLASALELAGINTKTGEGIIKSNNVIKLITKDDVSSEMVKNGLEEMLDVKPKAYMIIEGRKKKIFLEKVFRTDVVNTKIVSEIPENNLKDASVYRLSFYEDRGKFFMEDVINGSYKEIAENEIDKSKALNVVFNANTIDSKKMLRKKLDAKRSAERNAVEKSKGVSDYKNSLKEKLNLEEKSGDKYDIDNANTKGIKDDGDNVDGDNSKKEKFPPVSKLVGASVKELSNELNSLLDIEQFLSEEKLSGDKKIVVALTEAGLKFALANKAVGALSSGSEKSKQNVYALIVSFLEANEISDDEKQEAEKAAIISKLEQLLK